MVTIFLPVKEAPAKLELSFKGMQGSTDLLIVVCVLLLQT